MRVTCAIPVGPVGTFAVSNSVRQFAVTFQARRIYNCHDFFARFIPLKMITSVS